MPQKRRGTLEAALQATEEARAAAERARHATIAAVKATKEALSVNIDQMRQVEEMRRVYREVMDMKRLEPN